LSKFADSVGDFAEKALNVTNNILSPVVEEIKNVEVKDVENFFDAAGDFIKHQVDVIGNSTIYKAAEEAVDKAGLLIEKVYY